MNKTDLGLWLESLGFTPEYPFKGRTGKRRFRFDWAFVSAFIKVAVEYDGSGIGRDKTTAGGHQTIRGITNDADKNNEAQLCGWTLIRCNMVTADDGRCQEWVEAALASD